MAFKESLDVVLRDCKFLLSASQLEVLLPGVRSYLPPLTAIRFADKGAPRFVWGFPVIHGRRLIEALCQFVGQEEQKYLEDSNYQENLRLLTPAQLKEEPYFKVLSHHLLETLAEGAFLKLDSVLWIYLADLVCRRLNQDEVLAAIIKQLHPNEHAKLNALEADMSRLRYSNPQGFADVRNRVLRSLFARNDFANSSMKEVFDEVPSNLLNREMIANRLVYTERPEPIYRSLEVDEAFLIKGYRLPASTFSGVNRILRMVIVGMLERARTGNMLPLDLYFLTSFVDGQVRDKALRLPSQGTGFQKQNAANPRALEEAEERERIAYLLSLQEEPSRYLLNHLPLHDREYVRPIEKAVSRLSLTSRDSVKKLRNKTAAAELASQYAEAVRDILRWDLFQALKSRLRWVFPKDGTFYCDNRPLTPSTIPLNLDSFYEVYARSRRGTAVFIDLVGFTNRTKALTRELQEAATRGDKERYTLSSVSLAIQRVFSVRNHIEEFGGIPQGFEGDAILDTFPRAIDALRYVSAFADNYSKNRYIRFRPFERPIENPYKEGFRVGLASGDYSLISIVGRTNDLQGEKSTDRAVGHTINRASRLNSGKKGEKIFLSSDDTEREEEVPDPLNLFKVHVTDNQELHNDGIASFEDTFLELKRHVKSESMPWYEPRSGRGSTIAGVTPKFRNYTFEFIFEDPRLKRICLIRRLPRSPVLKGLEDEVVTVFEYLLFEIDDFLALVKKDAAIAPRPTARPAPSRRVHPLERRSEGAEQPELEMSAEGLPQSPFQWEDAVADPAQFLAANPGLSLDDVLGGPEAVRETVETQMQTAGGEGVAAAPGEGIGGNRIDISAVSVTSGSLDDDHLDDGDGAQTASSLEHDFRRGQLYQEEHGLDGDRGTAEEASKGDAISQSFRERLLSQEPSSAFGALSSTAPISGSPVGGVAYLGTQEEAGSLFEEAPGDGGGSAPDFTTGLALGEGGQALHAGGSARLDGHTDISTQEPIRPGEGRNVLASRADTVGVPSQGARIPEPAANTIKPVPKAVVLAWRGPRETRPAVDPPDAAGRRRFPRGAGASAQGVDPLESRVGGYVFSAIMTGGKTRTRRIVIGKTGDGKLEDVHIYPAPAHKMAPWVLDRPFTAFL